MAQQVPMHQSVTGIWKFMNNSGDNGINATVSDCTIQRSDMKSIFAQSYCDNTQYFRNFWALHTKTANVGNGNGGYTCAKFCCHAATIM